MSRFRYSRNVKWTQIPDRDFPLVFSQSSDDHTEPEQYFSSKKKVKISF